MMGMATTLRASQTNTAPGTSSTISVNAPTGTTTGDVVVLSIHGNGQTTITPNKVATPTSFTTGTKTADSTSAATASKSWVANRLYILTFISKTDDGGSGTNPNQPTASGGNITWVVPTNGSKVYDTTSSSRRRVTVFYGICSSNTTGTVTIDSGGQTQITQAWAVDEIASGFDTTTPIVQAASVEQQGADTSITATLAAFSHVNNATYGSYANGNGTTTATAGSGFTIISTIHDTVENNLTVQTEFKNTNDTTVDFTYSSDAEKGAIALEIKAENQFNADIQDYKPNTTGGHTVSIFSKRIVSTDPTTYNFTLGTSNRWSVIADTWQNPNTTTIYDVAPSTGNAAAADDSSAATIDAPTITTLSANAIHVVHGYSDDGVGGNPSGPAGYTAAGAATGEPQVATYKVIASAGATGAQTITATTSAPRIALSYAIKDIGPLITTSDSITLTENTVVSVSGGVTTLSVAVSDSITLTELVGVLALDFIVKSDSITLTENVTTNSVSFINVSDSVTLTEIMGMNPILFVNKSDSVTVTENIGVFLTPFYVTVSDSLTVTESIGILAVSLINISDSVTLSESKTVAISAVPNISISVSDTITIIENTNANPTLYIVISMKYGIQII